jgi:hypothetical protein
MFSSEAYQNSDTELEKINRSAVNWDLTPVSKRNSKYYLGRKYRKIKGKLKESFAKVSGDESSLSPAVSSSRCMNCVRLIQSLKERYEESGDRKTKYLILTLTPSDLTQADLQRVFGVGKRMAQTAVQLRKAHGALSYPPSNAGNSYKVYHILEVIV